MIRPLRERLAKLEGERLLVLAVGAHLVGLVDDDEVPVRPEEALLRVLDAGDPRDGGHHLVLLEPGILAVLAPKHLPAHDVERLTELVLHLALPLECEVCRSDDECPLDEAADLQLLQEEPGHDRLPGPRVVGQEEPDTGHLQEVVVDRFELVREGVHPGDR